MDSTQTFRNHVRWVPMYHFVLFAILLVNLLYKGVVLFQRPSIGAGIELLVAFALLLLAWYLRTFPLAVQDRVIRDEERERMARLLAEPLRSRIMEFTAGQLVALRFASDAELPELAQKVLDGNLHDRKAIKQMIRTWRPDTLRA